MGYFWIRIYDYDPERDKFDKGEMLDEYYLNDIANREKAKESVRNRYQNVNVKFAKPKRSRGLYAIVMDGNKFFYDRFYTMIDTYCFWHKCHRPIKGPAKDFPRSNTDTSFSHDEFGDSTVYFCSYECKQHFSHALHPSGEGEFQAKETGGNGRVFGYVYHIYNRSTNLHYVGQTRYMPFFRWQEHVKDGEKGEITDLTFSVLAEISKTDNDHDDQEHLNSLEAWWIGKFIEDGYEVMNVTKPRITIEYLKHAFDNIVAQNSQMELLL